MRAEILAREHAQHARQLQRIRGVDADDSCVRVRAAHERHVHHARQDHVVDVLAAAFHQLLGIGARDGLADVGVRPVDGAGIDDLVHDPAFGLRCFATVSTASTMA